MEPHGKEAATFAAYNINMDDYFDIDEAVLVELPD